MNRKQVESKRKTGGAGQKQANNKDGMAEEEDGLADKEHGIADKENRGIHNSSNINKQWR